MPQSTPQDLLSEAGRMFHAGQYEQAIAVLREVIRQRPDAVSAHRALIQCFIRTQRFGEAVAAGQDAERVHPRSAELLCDRSAAFLGNGQSSEAIDALRGALTIDPLMSIAWNNLGCALKDTGELAESMNCLRRAISLDPTGVATHNNLIYTMHFHPGCDMQAIRREQDNWVRLHTQTITRFATHANDRDPDRRLRVGYVSADFYAQAECYFVLPLIEAHDRTQFEVHCYSSVRNPDDITARYQRSADKWHDVLTLSDEQLAQKVHADQIDILIDLTMHMRYGRLPAFARKPAPIQVSWLAYPGSTGLPEMDYRLTDALMDPPDADASWSVEQPIRLPDSWCCYEAIGDAPPVGPLPAVSRGQITFGSLNNICKINDQVLTRWSSVLRATPSSQLLLLCPDKHARRRVTEAMQSLGIEPSRIEFTGSLPRQQYLELYNRIDLALDPFPYNGITTTCDALWMGVPVLTLPGASPASRAGLSLLSAAACPQWVARDEDDYIDLTTRTAGNLEELARTRVSLRQHLRSSPLMDARRFARNVESAFRGVWRKWATSH